MKRSVAWLGIRLAGGALLFASACNISEGTLVTCTSVAPHAMLIHVQSAVTHASIVDSARGATQGTRGLDSLRRVELSPTDTALAAGDLPAGRYTVHVARSGYQPWELANVLVVRDFCGAITVSLTAELAPE